MHHVNPTCGDEVTLRVRLEPADVGRIRRRAGGLVVADISYDALGCSISQASTSVLTDLAIGRPLTEVMSTLAEFTAMVTSRGKIDGDEDVLGDGIAFAGVSKYPARVKCALLGWMAFKDAAAQSLDSSSPGNQRQPHDSTKERTDDRHRSRLGGQRLTARHDHAGHDHSAHDHGARQMQSVHTHDENCADGHGSDRAGRAAADLDKVVAAAPAAAEADPQLIEDIEEALRDVVDPELGINIVDLGLVYDLHVDAENVATIDMTLTSAACPLTEMIEEQVSAALVGEAGLVDDFRINWVWLPPWGPEKITEDGREQMRALGFNI